MKPALSAAAILLSLCGSLACSQSHPQAIAWQYSGDQQLHGDLNQPGGNTDDDIKNRFGSNITPDQDHPGGYIIHQLNGTNRHVPPGVQITPMQVFTNGEI